MSTRGQENKPKWVAEHVGRITSSTAHKIVQKRGSTKPDKIVASLMTGFADSSTLCEGDSRAHGHELEDQARRAYIDTKSKCGHPVTVTQHGLFVDETFPFLASSTNGLISEDGGKTKGVLEIKCPHSSLAVDDLSDQRKSFFLFRTENGELHLKQTHSYYTQLQMEMALTKCLWADFVVFTTNGSEDSLFVERINFDVHFWEMSRASISTIYKEFVVLELVTRRLKRHKRLLA